MVGRRPDQSGPRVHKTYRKAQICNTHKTLILRKAELKLEKLSSRLSLFTKI